MIKVLQNHALGESDTELSQSRLKAIEILLKKSVPDLSAIEQTINGSLGTYEMTADERKARIKELQEKLGR